MTSSDIEFGAFTDVGPWVVHPDELTWKRGLAATRRTLQASLPSLTRARRLPPAARMGTTVRHLGGALALGLGAPPPGRGAPAATGDPLDDLGTLSRDRHVSAADVLARLAG